MDDPADHHYRIELVEQSRGRRALWRLVGLGGAALETPLLSSAVDVIVIDADSGEQLRRMSAPIFGSGGIEDDIRNDLATLDRGTFEKRWLDGGSSS